MGGNQKGKTGIESIVVINRLYFFLLFVEHTLYGVPKGTFTHQTLVVTNLETLAFIPFFSSFSAAFSAFSLFLCLLQILYSTIIGNIKFLLDKFFTFPGKSSRNLYAVMCSILWWRGSPMSISSGSMVQARSCSRPPRFFSSPITRILFLILASFSSRSFLSLSRHSIRNSSLNCVKSV